MGINRLSMNASNSINLGIFFGCAQPITDSPPKWMAELESEDIEMLKGKNNFPFLVSYFVVAG